MIRRSGRLGESHGVAERYTRDSGGLLGDAWGGGRRALPRCGVDSELSSQRGRESLLEGEDPDEATMREPGRKRDVPLGVVMVGMAAVAW